MREVAVVQRISLNSIALFLARVAQQGMALLLTVLVARYLGETGLGQVAFITVVVYVGNVFSTFGLDTLLLRQIAAERRTDTVPLAAALALELLLAALYILGVALLPLRDQSAEMVWGLRLYVWSLLPLALMTVTNAALRAYERMDLHFWLTAITAVLQLTGALVVLWLGGRLPALIGWLLAVQVIAAAMSWLVCRRLLPHFTINWQRLNRATLWQMGRAGFWLALLMVAAVLLQRLGILLLSWFADAAQTGQFAAAARLVDAGRLLPAAVFGALFPVLAHNRANLGANGRRYVWICRGAVVYGLVTAVSLTLLARPLLFWLFGAEYGPAAGVLRLLAWSLVPFALSLRYSVELVTAGGEKEVLAVTAVTLAITAVGARTALAWRGLTGVALALLAGEMVLAVGLWLASRSSW